MGKISIKRDRSISVVNQRGPTRVVVSPRGSAGPIGPTGSTGATGPSSLAALTAWLTATVYSAVAPASYVSQGGSSYACLISHTSGTFATDLAAGKWGLVASKGDTGATGSTGSTGSTGATGSAGISGTSAATRVRVVATANVAIATALENGDALDGVTLATNDLVLLTAQSATYENGVYVVQASGAAVRHTDFDTFDELPGTLFIVMEGTAKADTLWFCTTNRGGTIGVTAITISQFQTGSTEGTFTPTITTSGTVGTPAYTTNAGFYSKVGKLVKISWAITLSGWTGSPTGNVSIAGLPFTSRNVTNNNGGASFNFYSVAGLAANNYGLVGYISPNTSAIVLQSSGNTSTSNVTAAQLGATGILFGFAMYETDS